MMFDTAEAKCVLAVLKELEKGKSKYSSLFKETKFSHTTLQLVLRDLVKKKFVKKTMVDKLNTDYEISSKGKRLLEKLEELRELLR